MEREINSTNGYKDVLLKLMPSEIVAAYMVIDGLLPSEQPSTKWLALGTSLTLTVLTPIYLRKLYKIRNWSQIIFTTGTFVVWVYWMGGPFKVWGLHSSAVGSIILVLWTLLIPIVNIQGKIAVGHNVRITSKRPKDVEKLNYICKWDLQMNKYLGKRTYVTRVNRRRETAKLNIDNGRFVWSFEWLEPTNNKGENHDTKS